MKKIVFSLFYLLPLFCCAQNVNASRIQWTVVDVHNLNIDMHEVVQDKLISSPQSVEWLDAYGNFKFKFDVTSVTGQWSDTSVDGQVEFSFQLEGQPGTVVIKRFNNQLSATIQLYINEPHPQVYLLKME